MLNRQRWYATMSCNKIGQSLGRNNMADWSVQLLRLTVFFHGAGPIEPGDWWLKIVGEAPEVVNARPKQNQILIENAYGLGRLTLVVNPFRADWLYQVSSVDEDATDSDDIITSLGKLKSALDTFSDIVQKYFSFASCPPASRIALGAIMNIPSLDRHEAYKTLSEFLPFIHLDENSSDFLYQINRHRRTQVGELALKINRLSKWSAKVKSVENFVFGPTSIVRSTSEIKSMGSQLELDMSTQEDFSDAMDGKMQQELFSTLEGMALEIAEKGDIP